MRESATHEMTPDGNASLNLVKSLAFMRHRAARPSKFDSLFYRPIRTMRAD
jgi:hypothetical protein